MARDDELIELINRIKSLHGELTRLGVKPEYVNFRRLNAAELETEYEAVAEQLARRKKFTGAE